MIRSISSHDFDELYFTGRNERKLVLNTYSELHLFTKFNILMK